MISRAFARHELVHLKAIFRSSGDCKARGSATRNPRFAIRCSSAFTLLEVIIAMTIFSVISVAVFGVIDAALRTTDELQTSQRVNRQVSGFVELCRKAFATLPPQATLRSGPAEENDPPTQELVFRNAPLLFAFGGNALNYGSATIGLRPQEDGKCSLAISRSDFATPDESSPGATTVAESALQPDEQGRYWLVLVPDLEWAQWRFYDPRLSDWSEWWTQASRPRLIELEILVSGDTIPIRAVFPVAASVQL